MTGRSRGEPEQEPQQGGPGGDVADAPSRELVVFHLRGVSEKTVGKGRLRGIRLESAPVNTALGPSGIFHDVTDHFLGRGRRRADDHTHHLFERQHLDIFDDRGVDIIKLGVGNKLRKRFCNLHLSCLLSLLL